MTDETTSLRKLARCGLRGVKLVISDAHEGLKAAATTVLGATAKSALSCSAVHTSSTRVLP